MKTAFILPGLPRCATTSFANLLRQNPQVYLPEFKEPHGLISESVVGNFSVFDGAKYRRLQYGGVALKPEKYVEQYAAGLQDESVQCVVDASTLYSLHLDFLDTLPERLPGVEYRFLVSIREPWARAISHYRFSRMRGEEPRCFSQALDEEFSKVRSDWFLGGYAIGSRYDFLLREIIDRYGIDSVRVFDLDSDRSIDQSVLDQINDFLGLSAFNYSFDVYSNSANFSLSGGWGRLRVLARKLRGRFPNLFDLLVFRRLFELFLNMAPKSKVLPDEFDFCKEQFYECYESYGDQVVTVSELERVTLR